MTERRREIKMVMTQGRIEDDQDADFLEYWLSRPMAERIAHVEELRRDHHGDDYETRDRLPRSALRMQRRPG